MDASEIFCRVPAENGEGYQTVSLQTALDEFFALAVSLHAGMRQNAEMARQAMENAEKWAGLTNELVGAVEENAKILAGLAGQVRGTVVTAKAMLSKTKTAPGVH